MNKFFLGANEKRVFVNNEYRYLNGVFANKKNWNREGGLKNK